ncbi:MAG: lipid-A-disaccharide synthase [Porticoccaceae bacterium]|jgi:lipid-A-disaccharide synthase|nr:lipid-A-disaccharide synthase [Porticoccaceae bacterium]HLS97862.1 lipid-A-disaccharide synthase [Porticoccaceae bacterium]
MPAPSTHSVRIGIVTGEASGDQLGAGLMAALREHFPDALFEGIGGERMIAAGFHSLHPQERLAVMGLVEPLKRLPELLRIRGALYRHFAASGADLVVGIDSPDFNLGLELKLRRRGLLTAHYVSPSVWAWRQGRVKKIARAVDRMLTLLPFESAFYQRHRVPVTFVGHPLADEIPLAPDPAAARQRLGLPAEGRILAVMPGSRGGEVALMGPLFLDVMAWLLARAPALRFVVPSANAARHRQLEALLAARPELPVTLVKGNSHTAMEAADGVLLTSGTTALEAMLLKKPMVVAYRMGAGSYWLLSKLVKTPWISLPNLIAGKALVPELVQGAATVEALGEATLRHLDDDDLRSHLVATFTDMHRQLRRDASRTAASALAAMIRERREGRG